MTMEILWNQTERSVWDAAHATLGAALQQCWAYGDSLLTPQISVQRAEIRIGGERVALAQFLCRRYVGLFGVALCTRGPLWLVQVDSPERARMYRLLKQSLPWRHPRVILFSPDQTEVHDPALAALTRVLTGYSTVMLDLTRSDAELRGRLHPFWRNRLAAAERSGLEIREVANMPDASSPIIQEEIRQRQTRRFYALPPAFIHNYIAAHTDSRQAALILEAKSGSQTVAAMLFLVHGSAATYQFGWTKSAGRSVNAHNLILWRALALLRERGVRRLDLGGVNTHDLPGISRFKINTGGAVVTYAGGYV